MGQCTSNKAKGGKLSVKNILSHKKTKKMDKHNKHYKEPNNDDKVHPKENNKLLDPNKKPNQKYATTKGVAMSFGFKRRPTSISASPATSSAWEWNSDPNGNKDEAPINKTHHISKPHNNYLSSSSQKPASATITRPRFSSTERTNKVGDIKPKELDPVLNNRTFTRNLTVVTKTEMTETVENGRGATGKFTFQTTRLPQPESIRMVETKTAKTIANNNRKMSRQYDDTSCGVNSQRSFGTDANDDAFSRNVFIRERLHQDTNRFSLMENSDSFSDLGTPPPLPELPSVFKLTQVDTKEEKDLKNIRDDNKGKQATTFLKSSSPNTFLKTRGRNLLTRDSPQNSLDQDWLNGGEAMADDVSLTLSPKLDSNKQTPKKYHQTSTGGMTESVLQSLLEPCVSLEMIDSLKDSMHLSLSEEDPNFTAVAANNNTSALLDDEILSPVESLLSSSETEDIMKKKITASSSNSKDVNEKLTPSPPASPSHATYSLSLSDDKEDFLIDDEIADQPELVFEDGHNGAEMVIIEKLDSESSNQRRTSYNSEFSPMPLRKKNNFMSNANRGSLDSLSPCDSIGSEDLMMDYDLTQSNNDFDSWDRRSCCFDNTAAPKGGKFKSEELTFHNKNFFKSLHSRNSSPKRFNNRPSPELQRRAPFIGISYDSYSECLTMTRANHSAVQQDIIGIKTMLLTLKRVLNESETHHSLKGYGEDEGRNNNNNNSEFTLELADLKRQVIFLQGQLEDKEQLVTNLQKQIDDMYIQNTYPPLDNAPPSSDVQDRCNAATQTERTRPLSSGLFSLTTSPMDDNNPILRLMVK